MRAGTWAALAAAILCLPLARAADLPITLGVTGRLYDGSDQPVESASLPVTFRIFERSGAAMGEEILWEAGCNVAVSRGYYATTLGSTCGTGLQASHLPLDTERHLEIAIGGVTLSPRLRISAVPAATLAGRSLNADKLGDLAPADYWKKTDQVEAASLSAGVLGELDGRFVLLQGGGASLTAVPAAALTGTLPSSAIPTFVARTDGNQIFSGTVTATAFVGSGAQLTGLTASQLGGAIPDANLASGGDFARKSAANTFAAPNTFGSAAAATIIDGASVSTGTLATTGNATVGGTVTHQGIQGRLCPNDHYFSMGYCLPKGTLTEKTVCPAGQTLIRGVCYAWTSQTCTFQTLPTAMTNCSSLGGRLCTVAELDRLDGTGCGGDYSRAWANLAQIYDSGAGFGLCIRNQSGLVVAAGGTTRQSNANRDDIANCDAVQYAGATSSSAVDGMALCCFD